MHGRRARSRAAFFSRAGRGPRGPNVGTIHPPEIPVDLALLVESDLQGLENAIECPVGPPAAEAVIDAFPLAVAFGEITPGRAGAENPEHAIERSAMVVPFAAAFLCWEQAFKKFPLLVADIISRHGPP